MTTPDLTQVLFIQGGGEGAHDEWAAKLVDSLAGGLGDRYEVRYPNGGEPALREVGPGHCARDGDLEPRRGVDRSLRGGAVLINVLADTLPDWRPGAIVLLAAPFAGPGGWPSDEFELPNDLGMRLPPGTPVYVFHGTDDQTVPPSHADLYARVIPQASVHLLSGRDHQLNQDISDVANSIQQ